MCITEKNGLSPDEKKSILVKHNKLRKCLASGAEETGSNNYGQPAAAYMPDLVIKFYKLLIFFTNNNNYY